MSSEAGSSNAGKITDSSFDLYSNDIQGTALKATKLAVALPADINFNRTIDNDFARTIDGCSERALRLTNSLLELSRTNYVSKSRIKRNRKLEEQEDVVDSYGSLVVDVLDQLFERVDMNLDEYLGRSKPVAIPVNPPTASSVSTSSARQGRLDLYIFHAKDLPKPQLKFKKKVDNSYESEWSPRLRHKFNAQVPPGYGLRDLLGESDPASKPTSQNSHPYLYEIKHISYPKHMFEHKDTIAPASFNNTPYTWIDSKDRLDSLLDKLRHVQEIAVDLEHHSYRSFSGFLCLMQISTREEDFIIDALALREELEELNEIFTNPRIVKVFHGAESDVVWLQQDFNIYIVNLFDTYHASKLLDFPKHGLSALLEMYCDFVPDKRYQLADWRIRPLRAEMLNYARSDTHFLLYIYDSLRNALLDRANGQSDLIHAALDRSQETALRTYEQEVYDNENGNGPGGWNTLAVKWGRALFGMTRKVFRAVHAWRDAVAREEDESTRYVLPNHYLFQLAERPPADMTALLGSFRPIPPLIRTKAASLLDVVRRAVREALTDTGMMERSEDTISSQIAANASANRDLGTEELNEASVPGKNAAMIVENVLPDLWKRQSGNLAVASSLFLGSQRFVKCSQDVGTSSTQSALPPSGWISPNSKHLDASLPRYREVVTRIHSSLTVRPATSTAQLVLPESDGIMESEDSQNTMAGPQQIEIPFVPANQRISNTVSIKTETTDAIVIVGRSRERKRKRSYKGTGDIEKGGRPKKAKGGIEEPDGDVEAIDAKVDEFDYTSAPNFLDEPVKKESVTLKPLRGKASKERRTVEYGNFPAPPRQLSEVKGANLSHTFK